MFSNLQLPLEKLSDISKRMPNPISRKYCLNFAYSDKSIVNGKILKELFDPEKFMCKITPIHNNNACKKNGIKMIDGYKSYQPYKKPEQELLAAGFDVIVFVPSLDEENGLVTCGNAVLGGSKFGKYDNKLKIDGILG